MKSLHILDFLDRYSTLYYIAFLVNTARTTNSFQLQKSLQIEEGFKATSRGLQSISPQWRLSHCRPMWLWRFMWWSHWASKLRRMCVIFIIGCNSSAQIVKVTTGGQDSVWKLAFRSPLVTLNNFYRIQRTVNYM